MRITHSPYVRPPKLVDILFDDIYKGPDGVYDCTSGPKNSFLTKRGGKIYWQDYDILADESWKRELFTFNYSGMEKPT